MSLHKEELKASFSTLKRTARSDQDVLAWFRAHPETVPDIPEPLRPYIDLQIASSYPDTEESNRVGLELQVIYSAFHPDIKAYESQRSAEFEEITGSFGRFADSSLPRRVSSSFWMFVDAANWPYAAATCAYGWLSTDPDFVASQLAMLADSWKNLDAFISFEKVVELHRAGLLPEKQEDYVNWVVGAMLQEMPNSLALPDMAS